MTSFKWWHIEQKSHNEIVEILKNEIPNRPWATYFVRDYPLNPGNLGSVCRIGYVPFNKCIQDRYFYIDQSRNPEVLAAGGISTQIYWDYKPESLPAGWQGTVQRSYQDSTSGKAPNTMVALLAFTLPRFREKGFSGKVLTKMCLTGQQRGYRYCLVPALPPAQFQKQNVNLTMKEIAELRREDGEYYDYWIRLHTRKGAEIIGFCEQSHRFILSLEDFQNYISSDLIQTSGEHIVRMDKDQILGPNSKNMWQKVYADVERSFVTFDWGCVWAKYDLKKLEFESSD